MMNNLEKVLVLVVRVEQTKILVSRKGGIKDDRMNWVGERIEGVEEFKYLGILYIRRRILTGCMMHVQVRENYVKRQKNISTSLGIGGRGMIT